MLIGFIDDDDCRVPFDKVATRGRWGFKREIVLSMAEKEIAGRDYPGDIRVSELVRPVRTMLLQKRHGYYLRPDDVVDMWCGTVLHADIAKHNGELQEHTLIAQVHGATLSGTVDSYRDGVLKDFKSTKSWTYIMAQKDCKKNTPEYYYQSNCYSWLLRQHGYKVDKQMLVMYLKDWSASSWKDTMPESPLVAVDVPFEENIEQWVFDKVEGYLVSKGQPTDALPMCSETERYGKDKDGSYKRCKYYCDVQPFCAAIASHEQFEWAKGYEMCAKLWETKSNEISFDSMLQHQFGVDNASMLKFRFQWQEIWLWIKGAENGEA